MRGNSLGVDLKNDLNSEDPTTHIGNTGIKDDSGFIKQEE